MIKLFHGSIFDSKCDLLIIPCDNTGGVTSKISDEIDLRNLPYFFDHSLGAGDVSFSENTGGISNASAVGYAASVDLTRKSSSEDNLKKIIHSIKYYCYENSFHKVNLPLLGTGAGMLSPEKSYDIIRQEFIDTRNITLCVYTLSRDIYDKLNDSENELSKKQLKNPRVFISYTGANIENRNWVKKFACRLRSSGVDARLDMFHLKPGQDMPQWMTNEIIMADKVLLICDHFYAEKADSRKGGVGWETMIIQGDMLSKQEQNKYIAILRDKEIDRSLPIYVKSKYALNCTSENMSEEDFKELLLYLFDCDIEPPIGEIPDYIKEKISYE